MNKPVLKQKISFDAPTLTSLHIVGSDYYIDCVLATASEFGSIRSSESGDWWWLEIKPNYDAEEVKKYLGSLEFEE